MITYFTLISICLIVAWTVKSVQVYRDKFENTFVLYLVAIGQSVLVYLFLLCAIALIVGLINVCNYIDTLIFGV